MVHSVVLSHHLFTLSKNVPESFSKKPHEIYSNIFPRFQREKVMQVVDGTFALSASVFRHFFI